MCWHRLFRLPHAVGPWIRARSSKPRPPSGGGGPALSTPSPAEDRTRIRSRCLSPATPSPSIQVHPCVPRPAACAWFRPACSRRTRACPESDHFRDCLGQLPNRHILAASHVDERRLVLLQHGIEQFIGKVHQQQARIRHVVAVQKLPPRRPGPPNHYFAITPLLRLMHLADQRRQHVRGLQIVVVARTIQIGGHHGQITCPVLPVVRPAHLDAGDLGDRIGAVGGLERPGQKVFLLDRLRAIARVDAGRAEEQQTLHAGPVGLVDDVGLDRKILGDELRRVGVVGQDAAHLGCRQEHVFGLLGFEEAAHSRGIAELQFGVGPLEDAPMARRFQAPDECRPHQPAMSGHVDPALRLHAHSW